MDKSLLLILLILVILVCLYYKNNEKYTNSNSNIWKIGETLKIGDVKSSPNGEYKYMMTENGLQYYSQTNKIYEKYNNPNQGWWFYPTLEGSKNSSTATLQSNGVYILFTNGSLTSPFNSQIGTFKNDDNKYILSNFAINGGYNVYDTNGKLLFNTNSNQNNTKYNNKLYNNSNLSISGVATLNIYKLVLTDSGTFGFDKNNKLLFVN